MMYGHQPTLLAALVKCRKVGAKNWGKSKKEGVNETTKMKPQVKKLLKQKGYSPIFQKTILLILQKDNSNK